LFGDEQFGIADDVDEEDMRDFEPQIWFSFGGHSGAWARRIYAV
jgi:hypothetical protein